MPSEQPFHTASVSKVLTATLVAMLVEAGDLEFDTPVGAVLPSYDVEGLPAADAVTVARDVTVEHLLTHQRAPGPLHRATRAPDGLFDRTAVLGP